MSEQMPVADSPIERTARGAARRLEALHGSRVGVEVEAALHKRGTNHRPDQYSDPVSTASLIVSTATLAWTIYNDLRSKTPKPAREVIMRSVRLELPTNNETPAPASQDEIIDAVVDEIIEDTKREDPH